MVVWARLDSGCVVACVIEALKAMLRKLGLHFVLMLDSHYPDDVGGAAPDTVDIPSLDGREFATTICGGDRDAIDAQLILYHERQGPREVRANSDNDVKWAEVMTGTDREGLDPLTGRKRFLRL